MGSVVSWNLQLAVKEGKSDALRALMSEMVESTRDEPGATAYEWFTTEDGSVCHIYERYSDSDAVLTHLGNFGARFAERFLDCLEPRSFSVYGDPSSEVREALAGLGPTYLGEFGGFTR